MELHEKIMKLYPDITEYDFFSGTIMIKNDSDGTPSYLHEWKHPVHPRPTQEQLDAITE